MLKLWELLASLGVILFIALSGMGLLGSYNPTGWKMTGFQNERRRQVIRLMEHGVSSETLETTLDGLDPQC